MIAANSIEYVNADLRKSDVIHSVILLANDTDPGLESIDMI